MKQLLIFIVICLCMTSVGCGDSPMITNEISRDELLLMHNKQRSLEGLSQMQMDADLARRAQEWAETMVARNRLRHGSLSGTKFRMTGENIAWGQNSIDQVMEAWMNSTGHRRNILNKRFTHAGFGYARYADGRPYWCAQFGGD